MADKINFFGFTGENTVGDLREFFENEPVRLEELARQVSDSIPWVYYRIIIDLIFKKVLDPKSYGDYRSYRGLSSTIYHTISEDEKRYKLEAKSTDNLTANIKLCELYGILIDDKKEFFGNSYNDNARVKENWEEVMTTAYANDIDNSSRFARRKLLERTVLTDEFKGVLEHYIATYYPEKKNYEEITLGDVYKYSLEKIFDDNLRGKKKQFVLTGAPGTGKTYSVRELTKAYINEKGGAYEFVQFHSSYDYTDFVEGLKPIRIGDSSENVFVRMDGVFKSFCRKAENEIIARTGEGSRSDAVKDAPLCFFLIDEINRADLSRVFGELMFSLEESYRGPEHRIKTQYSSLPTYDAAGNELGFDVFKEGFFIPENVIIIGTMNDIDRNVESFDFALRRRFSFIEIDADDSLKRLEEIMGADYDAKLEDHAKALNQVIEAKPKLGPAFKLGLTYFKDRKKDQDLGEYFDAELNGILREYVRGWKKTEQDAFIKDCKIAFTKAPESDDENQGNS